MLNVYSVSYKSNIDCYINLDKVFKSIKLDDNIKKISRVRINNIFLYWKLGNNKYSFNDGKDKLLKVELRRNSVYILHIHYHSFFKTEDFTQIVKDILTHLYNYNDEIYYYTDKFLVPRGCVSVDTTSFYKPEVLKINTIVSNYRFNRIDYNPEKDIILLQKILGERGISTKLCGEKIKYCKNNTSIYVWESHISTLSTNPDLTQIQNDFKEFYDIVMEIDAPLEYSQRLGFLGTDFL